MIPGKLKWHATLALALFIAAEGAERLTVYFPSASLRALCG
ncbi:MAG: hypothetical protein C5S49_02640 [Candidatus Methanogaster sp.]|nr:MAG: hypothetical protein C5S49_02640 [ANME-2 cluster archaeon]